MNIEKTITDVFDAIASVAGKLSAAKSPELPDLSWVDVDRLLPDDIMSDPALFYTKSDVVPDVKFELERRLPFVEVWKGTYPSPIQTEFPENNTVHVKHFRAWPRRKNRPTIVVVNGLQVDAAFDFYFEWWCLRFVAWGFDSAVVTIPYSQARTPAESFSGQLIITPETKWTLLSMKQTFDDLQQFVNWLKADGAGPVGLFGVSFGGMMSCLYTCNADNADFAIACMPPVDIADLFSKWDFTEEWKRRESNGELTMLSDKRVHRLMSLCLMKPRISTSKIFMAAGDFDHLVTPSTVDNLEREWGGMPWLRRYQTGHINTFALNFRMINDLHNFIKSEIL